VRSFWRERPTSSTADQTGGAFFAFEDELEGGKTTPLHCHPTEDEFTYVVDGEILVYADEQQRRAERGAVIVMPRGVPHAFLVTSPSARLLFLQIPGDRRRILQSGERAPRGLGQTCRLWAPAASRATDQLDPGPRSASVRCVGRAGC
jgi:quercetin dioxygenase-like cupin family protein